MRLTVASPSAAAEHGFHAPASANLSSVRLPYAIDGDTIEDRATGERFRLPNIDTAESGERAKCPAERAFAARATKEARRVLARARIVQAQRSGQTDRYGRTLAFVIVDGVDLGRHLMQQGLARPWTGRRMPWCGAGGQLLSA